MLAPAVLIPLGISGYFAAQLGSDPYSVFVDGVRTVMGITPGMVVIIFNAVVITLMLFFGRRYLKFGTVFLAMVVGPLIDVFLTLLTGALYFSGEPDLILRAVVMLCGAVTLSVGIGLLVAIDFGIGTLEWIIILVSKLFKLSVGRAKIVLDAFLVATGWLMGGLVGVGTVIGIVLTGLLIDVTLKLFANPIKRYVGPLSADEANRQKSQNV